MCRPLEEYSTPSHPPPSRSLSLSLPLCTWQIVLNFTNLRLCSCADSSHTPSESVSWRTVEETNSTGKKDKCKMRTTKLP